MEWIKTDDFQYCRKISEYKYELIQANYIDTDDDLEYGICKPKEIDLNYWIKNGEYDDECKEIILSYYDSIEEFNKSYDDETRKQVLAEMIYEETYRYMDVKYGRVTEDQAEKILEHYVKTGEYLELQN